MKESKQNNKRGRRGSSGAKAPNKKPIQELLAHWTWKFAEHELLTFVAKGLAWLINNFWYVTAFVVGITTTIVRYFNVVTEHPILQYLKTHPERASIAAIALAVFSPFIRAIFSFIWKGVTLLWIHIFPRSDQSPQNSEPSSAEALIQATGISAFSPHFTKSEKAVDWAGCNKRIKSNKATDLRIMGATGWNTFGDPKAPLYKLLERFTGEVKILLMKPDPKLPALIQRASEVGITPQQYANEIENSIARLKQLKQKGRNISLKVYAQTPIWKMVISNDYMWLQHYCKSKDVEDTPVYVFFSDGDGGTSLFHALYSVWLKRWDVDNNETYNLA